MKKIFICLYSLFLLSAGFFSGFKFLKMSPCSDIVIVEKEKIKTVPIYVQYDMLTREELTARVTCYDTAEPLLDMTVQNNVALLNAGLCERKWSREIKIASDSQFTYYLGLAGVAVGLTAGFILLR